MYRMHHLPPLPRLASNAYQRCLFVRSKTGISIGPCGKLLSVWETAQDLSSDSAFFFAPQVTT